MSVRRIAGSDGGRSATGLLIAALVLLCLAIAWAKVLPDSLRMWSALFLVVLLPGAAISFSRLARGLDLWERVAASLVGGLIVLVAAGLASQLAGWGLRGVVWLVPASTIFIALAGWAFGGARAPAVKKASGEEEAGAPGPESNVGSRHERMAIGAFMLLVLIFASSLSGEMGPGTDAFDHLATIREIRDTGELFPLTTSYKYPEAPLPDPRKGLFHAGLAAMCVYTELDPVDVWIWLPRALLPVALLVVVCLGRALTGSVAGGVISAVLWLCCFGGPGSGLPVQVGYAHNVSEIASWMLILMLVKYAGGGRRRLVAFSAVGLAACCFIHISVVVLTLAAWGCFLAAAVLLGGEHRCSLGAAVGRAGLLWLVLAVPAATTKALMSYAPANPIQLQSQNLLYLTDSLYVVNPMWIYSWLGTPGVLSVVLAVWLAFQRVEAPRRLYLVGASVIPILVVLNPLLVPAFYSVVGYLVERFTWVVPYPYVLSLALLLSFNRLRHSEGRASKLVAGAIALVVVGSVSGTAGSRYARDRASAASYEDWLPALEYLREEVEEPAVVASDMLTSYSIPAFTKHHIVSTLHQHGSPNDPAGVDRVIALIDIMNPYAEPAALKRKLQDREVDFILVNRTFDRRIRLYFTEVVPSLLEKLDRRLKEHPEVFREAFREGELSLYAVDRAALEGWSPEPEGRAPYALDPGEEVRGDPVGEVFEESIELVSVDIDADSVERGDELGVTCYWRAVIDRPSFDLPWVVQVRIQRDYHKGALYSPSLSKIYRRALEFITGERFRWRHSHLPAGGVFPPLMWSEATVVDKAGIRIPGWMKPGEYEVTVSIGREPVYPTFGLRDFLRDDDRYSGVKVGTIEVR